MDEDYLFEFIRILPKNGEWRFESQRKKWIHAISLAVDLVMDRRKLTIRKQRFAEQVELTEIRDIGECGVIIFSE